MNDYKKLCQLRSAHVKVFLIDTYAFITLQVDYIVENDVTISIYNFVKESYKFKKAFKVMLSFIFLAFLLYL